MSLKFPFSSDVVAMPGFPFIETVAMGKVTPSFEEVTLPVTGITYTVTAPPPLPEETISNTENWLMPVFLKFSWQLVNNSFKADSASYNFISLRRDAATVLPSSRPSLYAIFIL